MTRKAKWYAAVFGAQMVLGALALLLVPDTPSRWVALFAAAFFPNAVRIFYVEDLR